MAVKVFKEIVSQLGIARFKHCGIADQFCGVIPNLGGRGNPRLLDHPLTCHDEILDLTVDEAAQDEFAMGAWSCSI